MMYNVGGALPNAEDGYKKDLLRQLQSDEPCSQSPGMTGMS